MNSISFSSLHLAPDRAAIRPFASPPCCHDARERQQTELPLTCRRRADVARASATTRGQTPRSTFSARSTSAAFTHASTAGGRRGRRAARAPCSTSSAAATVGDATSVLTNLTRRANDAFTGAVAARETRSAVGGLATRTIGARIGIAHVHHARRLGTRRVANLAHATSWFARVRTHAVDAGLSHRTHDARAGGHARGPGEVVIGHANLIRWARHWRARVGDARASIAGFVATLARHVVAVVDDAGARSGACRCANRTTCARHARARILATRGAFADAHGRLDTTGQFGTLGRALNVAHGVLDRLFRTITAEGVVVDRAVLTQRHTRAAFVDLFALLSRWAWEFTRATRRCALTTIRAFDANLAGRARIIGSVVDHAVAIVVFAIAFFGRGALTAKTREDAIFTRIMAAGARSDIHAASVPNRPIGGRKRVCRSIEAIGRCANFVDIAVAIVVDSVANFGSRTKPADTYEPACAVALQDAGLARRIGSITWVRHRVVRRRAAASERNAVVDGAVAIIVAAVAAFGNWRNIVCAIEVAHRAHDGPLDAVANIRTAFATDAGKRAVVDGAVAVVVQAVARFAGRTFGGLTNPATCPRARERAAVARRRQRPITIACAAWWWTPVQPAERTASARIIPTTVLPSRRTIRKRGIVNVTVTVVVDSVAGLGLRVYATLTNQYGVHTSRHASSTRRLIDAAWLIRSECVIVDHAIAIVVDPIAKLGARAHEARARATCLRALPTLAIAAVIEPWRRTRGNTRGRRHVVHGAVAIVVRHVADLGGRIGWTNA